MKTYIVLLKGINVGGHKKVPMAELRALLSYCGFDEVRTYIQSGNIVLKSTLTSKYKVESLIEMKIQKHFGFEVPVIVKTSKEFNMIFNACPFSEEKKSNSYFVILSKVPSLEYINLALKKTYDHEEVKIIGDGLYFYSSMGYGKSKFNMNWFEKTLKVKATSRNYKTMVKLLTMSEAS